jgi:hypothetical protein
LKSMAQVGDERGLRHLTLVNLFRNFVKKEEAQKMRFRNSATHRSRLIGLLIASTLTGCATADFTPYVGAQQKWPTSSGAFVQTIEAGHGPMSEGGAYKLPVYYGPPERPYRVIGYLEADSGSLAIWQSGKIESLRPAVKVAARHGADALILVAQDVETRGSTTSSFGNFSSNTSISGANYGNTVSGNANTTGGFFGSSFTTPNRHGKARVIAIKFI